MKMGKEKEKKHKHHRKPKSLGGTNDKRNISLVKNSKHESWHHLFKNYTAYQIAEVINALYLDPDYQMVAVRNYNTK